MIQLTFYTKPNCPLCDEARDMLEDITRDFTLTVTEVNILTDLDIYERYKYLIPVIELENGRVIAARFSEKELRQAFLDIV